jgi:hypothetical protein
VKAERLDLAPDESLLAAANASFRGAAGGSLRASSVLGSSRARHELFLAWRDQVSAVGFPTAGEDMRIALTDQRLIVCQTSFWLSRPVGVAGSLPLDEVAEVAIVRQPMLTGVALAIKHKGIVELEAVRGRRLRRLARLIQDQIAKR